MLLLNCCKGQSLEKVEKLCRTATAGKKFPTHINNSHHTFATRKRTAQISLHLRLRRTIKRNNVSANDRAHGIKVIRFVSSIACADVNRFQAVTLCGCEEMQRGFRCALPRAGGHLRAPRSNACGARSNGRGPIPDMSHFPAGIGKCCAMLSGPHRHSLKLGRFRQSFLQRNGSRPRVGSFPHHQETWTPRRRSTPARRPLCRFCPLRSTV
jgi:hypothetical protein